MGKARTNITVDEEILEAAREEGLNISKVAEKALKEKVMLLKHGKLPENSNNIPNQKMETSPKSNSKTENSNGASGGEYTKG